MSDRTLTVDGETITLSHPDKVLFPEHGLSKSDLADYYQRVAPMMLPHLRDRPLTLHRFPDGIGAHGFYQQNRSDYFPDWLPAASIDHPGGTGTHHRNLSVLGSDSGLRNSSQRDQRNRNGNGNQGRHPDAQGLDAVPAK